VSVRAGFLAAGFLLAASAALAQSAALPKLQKDSDYTGARKALLSQGYEPAQLPNAEKCEKSDPRCFPEVFACAGTGLAACVYTWRRGQTVIEVHTIGEQPIIQSVRCRANCR